jgi:outer membrane protein assembly complex protein YaeT
LLAALIWIAIPSAATAWSVSGELMLWQETSINPPPPDSFAYEGLRVKDIQFPGISNERDLEEFRTLVKQQVGQPLERNLIRLSIQQLHATGRFADIRVEGTSTADGEVSIAFITAANAFIAQVEVEGTPDRPTPSQVINASKLQMGSLFTKEKLDRALSNITQLMETNGFYRSSVTADQRPHPEKQQMDIVLHVHPGAQARVGKVSMTGDLVRSVEELQDTAKLHSGDLVTVRRVSDALDRLRKRFHKQNRWLSQISITERAYRSEANVVDFNFLLTRGPVVTITAEGYKLSRSVIKRNVPVYEENTADDDLLNEGRRNLLNYMQSLGFYSASVTLAKQASADGSELGIVYTIHAGARHKLAAVLISGNKYFPETLLRARLQIQPADRFVYPRGRFSQGLLNSDVRSLETLYQAGGFRDVKVTGNVEDDYRGVENLLAVHLQIEEGPQTLVEKLTITGVQKLSPENFPALNTGAGQPFSESSISADRDILLNYYFNLGFPNATFEASASPSPDKANRMEVTYALREGDQVFVDQIFLSGLVHTREFIVQRELEIKTDDPLSQVAMLKTQQNLYDLGIFSQVDTAVQNPDGAEPTKNVLFSMHEAKRYTFTYGAGLEFQTGQPGVGTTTPLGATGVSPLVSLEVTRLNFLGRNHTVAFKANVGRLQQRGLIGYTAPRLFGSRNWTLKLTTFYDNTVDVTTFTSQRLEGSVQVAETVNKATQLNYNFSFRRVKASDIEISPTLIPLLSQPVRVGGPGFTYIRNKRDNELESTKGSYNTVDFSLASSSFGSEADFTRILTQNTTYYAFGKNRPSNKKFVFARSTRIGVQNIFGNTVILQPYQTCQDPTQTTCPNETLVPLAERFLAGGGNSDRGFGLNQAGPRDPQTGFPLGGSALFLNNVELRFPPRVWPYVQDNLSFAVFEDAGNVFTDGRTMLDNLLRWRQKNPESCRQPGTVQPGPATYCDYAYVAHAIGLGVRYKTPVGPVRFDFGYNLNPPVFPSCSSTPNPAGSGASPYCKETSTPYFVPQQASHFNVFFSIGQSF